MVLNLDESFVIEIIEVKHTDLSKNIFASVAFRAARYIVGKDNGIFKMGNLMK